MPKEYFFILLLLIPLAGKADSGNEEIKAVKMIEELRQNLDPTQLVNVNCNNSTPEDENKYLISDSLVENLSCKTLTFENVFEKRREDAFSVEKHWPMVNWNASLLGQCWGLSLSQRRLFYLARFPTGGDKKNIEKGEIPKEKLLKLIRREDPAEVFKMDNLTEEKDIISIKEDPEYRNEIMIRQKKRFYRSENLSMLFSSRERDDDTNKETIKTIQKNIKNGRMPLVVLRATRTAQHAVLIKKCEPLEGLGPDVYSMTCYDSNSPGVEKKMLYYQGQFYADDIMGIFLPNERDPETGVRKPLSVGVFLKDDPEMDEIQQTAYNYYANLCSQIK